MKTQKSTQSLKDNEQGLAAIVVTVFVMIMLSLVVLAFSQISHREQQQSLDRQLTTQAFYSAEAGINSTVNKIRANPATVAIDQTTCPTTVSTNNKLDTAGISSYSCVLYDKAPKELQYGKVTTDQGQLVSLKTQGGDLSTVTFEWNGTDKDPSFGGCTAASGILTFPKATAYGTSCSAGMLRVEFMPADTGNLTREQLINNTYTVYIRPLNPTETSVADGFYVSSGSNIAAQGNVIGAKCSNTTGKCKASIVGLPKTTIFMHVRSIYTPSDLTISGLDSGGNGVRYNDAQIKIDSTGKARDVLRRLQVRVPLYETYAIPGYAVDALSGICKQLDVLPDNVSSTANCSSTNYFN